MAVVTDPYTGIASAASEGYKSYSSGQTSQRASRSADRQAALDTLMDMKKNDQDFTLKSKQSDRDFQYDMTALSNSFAIQSKQSDQTFQLGMATISSKERLGMAEVARDNKKNDQDFMVANTALASNERIETNKAKETTRQEFMKMIGVASTAGATAYSAKKSADKK